MKLIGGAVSLLALFAALEAVAHTERSALATAAISNAHPSEPAQIASAPAETASEPNKKISAYTLPPELYRKAKTLGRVRFSFGVFSFLYGLFLLWFILRQKYSAKFRDWAEAATGKWYLQVFIYAPRISIGWRHAADFAALRDYSAQPAAVVVVLLDYRDADFLVSLFRAAICDRSYFR
jgi:hypothetical protein